MVTALASHQRGSSLSLVLTFSSEGFCPGTPVFLPPQKKKPNISKFQLDQDRGPTQADEASCLNVVIYLIYYILTFQCKYAKLKKKTRFPEHMMINDSGWTRSSDDLLMWERNLRASEVKPTNGVLSRPVNDKRT